MKLSTIIMLFFLIGTISVPIFTWRYIKKKESGAAKKNYRESGAIEQKTMPVTEYLPIKDIWGNMLVLDRKDYVMLIRTSAANYPLMSEPEQHRFESVLLQVASQFRFYVQICARATMVDVTPVYETMKNNLPYLQNDAVKIYTAHLIEDMDRIAHQRNILDRERYIVISYNTLIGREKAKTELERRANSLIHAYNRANIKAEILSTAELTDTFYGYLNRGSTFKPSKAINSGALELAVTGKGGYINAGNENQKNVFKTTTETN